MPALPNLRPFPLALLGAVLLLVSYAARVDGVLVPPLDDAFIHAQYATALAEGHPFTYGAGEPFSSGATSLLWPVLLAPGALLGLRGLTLYLWALGLGVVALAWTATLIGALLEARGAPRWMGMAAVGLCGPLVWGCYSGMEIGLVALAVAGVLKTGAEALAGRPARAFPVWLGVLALARPEGLAVALAAAALVGSAQRRPPWAALGAAGLGLVQPVLNRVLTGAWVGSSVVSKQWPMTVHASEVSTLGFVWNDLLGKGDAVAFFGPLGVLVVGLAGLGAAALCADAAERRFGLLCLGTWLLPMVGMAASVPVPANHYRYLMPGLVPMMVLVVEGVRVIGRAVAREVALQAALAVSLVPGALGWTQELADNAADIRTQHVAAARWIAAHTEPGTRIAVNDAGFVAALADRPVLDLMGIVTPSALPYLMAGEGGQLALLRAQRPAWMAVFPAWFPALDRAGALRPVWSATLAQRSISGADTLAIVKPDWDALDRAERPPTLQPGEAVTDTLDVGDPDAEAAHAFTADEPAIEAGRGNQVLSGALPDGTVLVEAARRHTVGFAFTLAARPGPGRLMVRLGPSSADAHLTLDVDGRTVGWTLPAVASGAWAEGGIPVSAASSTVHVRAVVDDAAPGTRGGVSVARWWWVSTGG